MKKISTFVALVAAITLSSCSYDDSGINNRLNEFDNRLEKLEGTTLPSIDEQIESINASIADLKVVDTELHILIDTIEADAVEHSELIATLQTKASELESKIATLEEYVDSEITATEDWAAATFATLKQYAEVQSEISTLKALIEQNKSDITKAYTTAIAEAIATSEGSMKEWVSEQLAGYYTIAETDAKLELLQSSIDTLSESLAEEVETLSGRIDTMKSELTEAYEAAITEAIETNNGVINSKIADEINSVNSRIDEEVASINARIDALEGRIKDLEDALDKIKALDIVFDIESGEACIAGSSIEFGYAIVGGDQDTEVESFGDGGWRADVTPTDATSGRIRVTAPKDGGNGKVIVLATSGAGASTMKSIRFDEGVIADILDSYKVDWEACTLEVKLRTNLDYTVNIPVEAQSWLSVADTRAALREDTLTFTIAENPEDEPARSATVKLVNELGETLQSFEIVQNIQNNKYGAFYIKSVTSTAVTVSTTPEAFVVEYYVYVRDKTWADGIVEGYGESMLATLVKYPSAGAWHLTAANEQEWGGLMPATDYYCMILTVDNRGAEVLSKIEFRTADKSMAAPEVELVLSAAEGEGHKALFISLYSAEAASVKVVFDTKADIAGLRKQDYSDDDIVNIYGMTLSAEQVEAVRTTGISLKMEDLFPELEYIAIVSVKNAEQTATIKATTKTTDKKPVPARVESDLFTSLLGEWEVSYQLQRFNLQNVSIDGARVTIAQGADATTEKRYREQNRLVILNWPFNVTAQGVHDAPVMQSPEKLMNYDPDYWGAYPELAYRDYGPKIFLEIGAGDVVTVPTARNEYLYNWPDSGGVFYFLGGDLNNQFTAPATFPVTISADGNTLTIGAHHSGEEFSYGIYRPSVFRRGNDMWAVATSDIVLKRVK